MFEIFRTADADRQGGSRQAYYLVSQKATWSEAIAEVKRLEAAEKLERGPHKAATSWDDYFEIKLALPGTA